MTDDLLRELTANPDALASRHDPLPDDVATPLIAHLKHEADRHWWIDAHRSLELANWIVQIGEQRGDRGQMALGLMARGDALKFLGEIEAAWDALDAAGAMFREGGDEVGWGRTRIGRLLISPDLNRVDEALRDAEAARAIFIAHGAREILLRLDLNTGIVCDLLGDYHRALEHYQAALDEANALGEAGRAYLGALYGNMGYAYSYLGALGRAMDFHQQSHAACVAQAEPRGAAVALMNIAYIEQAQGHYRRALARLHAVIPQVSDQLLLRSTAQRDRVECYLALNRYAEARELARQVVDDYRASGSAYEMARTLLLLAVAEAELGNFDPAKAALDTAEDVFASLGSEAWLATSRLRRARIALQQGDLPKAEADARAAVVFFEAAGQQSEYASGVLVQARALLAAGDDAGAEAAARAALRVAQQARLAGVRYGAHLVLGRVWEQRGRTERATRAYHAAARAVERVQQRLTITLRPGFLEDKQDALRGLIRLYLGAGEAANAFDALERAKSQALLSYVANRETLRWSREEPRTRALVEELDRLRAEHHWYYRVVHEPRAGDDTPDARVDVDTARQELAIRERRMRAITEQLYLAAGEGDPVTVDAPPQAALRAALGEESALIEYYTDVDRVVAFVLDRAGLHVEKLPTTASDLARLIDQLRFNVTCALRVDPHAPAAAGLARVGRQLLARLYAVLVAPLVGQIAGCRRWVIVPFGVLHYLPFHLLVDGATGRCLIEQHEVVTLPAAGLLTRAAPRRAPGALVLTHSRGGLLPQTQAEGARVHAALGGGALYHEADAGRARLESAPRQVLHIAAHGEHRIDQPDLSYIELADGQLFTDDLLQHDLSYELVTLSACETGRARVAAGDELIGLGRGFLYAGAGALLTSLWRIEDGATAAFMEGFYRALAAGASKSAALRQVQCALLDDSPGAHPAYWGAFQLVGDPRPLSG